MTDKKHAAGKGRRLAETPGGEAGRLELVVKCDSMGVTDAIAASIAGIQVQGVALDIIHMGVGAISKSDLVMALTGSKLVVGFNVELMPKLDHFVRENGLEVRLYQVIYTLTEDLRRIARSLLAHEPGEDIVGKARVIALFKTSPKDSILGCEVLEGSLQVGRDFRVIAAMGPIYTGKIESLQIERKAVTRAVARQQVGIKIHGFNKARLGDLIESFRTAAPKVSGSWSPKGEVIHVNG